MGWDIEELRISIRLERHNSDGDVKDNEARDRLAQEVRDLIEADPDYRRIVTCGP